MSISVTLKSGLAADARIVRVRPPAFENGSPTPGISRKGYARERAALPGVRRVDLIAARERLSQQTTSGAKTAPPVRCFPSVVRAAPRLVASHIEIRQQHRQIMQPDQAVAVKVAGHRPIRRRGAEHRQ